MGSFFGKLFMNLVGGYLTNQFMGGGGQQDMDYTAYESTVQDSLANLTTQIPQITDWALTEKNFVDVSKDFDVKAVTDSARTDLEDATANIQEFDVKTGFDSSGIVDTMQTEETEAVYDAMNKAYTQFDILSEREKSGIDFNAQMAIAQVEAQINNILSQYAGTTGETLDFTYGDIRSGEGFEEVTQMGTADLTNLQYGTGSYAGTTPNPYGLSGSDWMAAQGYSAGLGTDFITSLGGAGSGYGQPNNPGGFTPSGNIGQTFNWETNQYAAPGEGYGYGFPGWGMNNVSEQATSVTAGLYGQGDEQNNMNAWMQYNSPEVGAQVEAGGNPFGPSNQFTANLTFDPASDPVLASYLEGIGGGTAGYSDWSQQQSGTYNWSDRRLKQNITLVGTSPKGHNIYEFDYKDNSYGPHTYRGVMSDEVDFAVIAQDPNGYDLVNYNHPDLDVNFERVNNG